MVQASSECLEVNHTVFLQRQYTEREFCLTKYKRVSWLLCMTMFLKCIPYSIDLYDLSVIIG